MKNSEILETKEPLRRVALLFIFVAHYCAWKKDSNENFKFDFLLKSVALSLTINSGEMAHHSFTGEFVYYNRVGGCTEETFVYAYGNTELEPTLKHDYAATTVVLPTCTAQGYTTYDGHINALRLEFAGR